MAPSHYNSKSQRLILANAARRMLGDFSLKQNTSPILKRTIQRLRDAGSRGELVLMGGMVEYGALVSWARRQERIWAKNLGVAFQALEDVVERIKCSDHG